MFISEQTSNLAQWVSEFPKYAAHFNGPRRAHYASNPPPITGKYVTNRQWNQITKNLNSLRRVSETLTGDKSSEKPTD